MTRNIVLNSLSEPVGLGCCASSKMASKMVDGSSKNSTVRCSNLSDPATFRLGDPGDQAEKQGPWLESQAVVVPAFFQQINGAVVRECGS